MMIINPYSFVAPNNFEAEYNAILNYAVSQGFTVPSATNKIKQNQLIIDLKASGEWSLIDVLYIFWSNIDATTGGDSDFACINWKSPGNHQVLKVNSPTFNDANGFTGNGTSSYLDTKFNPSTSGVNYLLNTASRGIWIHTDGGTDVIDGISVNNNLNNMSSQNVSGQRINSFNTLNASANLSGTGYIAINRSSSTNVQLYNGVTQITRTQTSTSIENASQRILATNTQFATHTVSMYFMGGNLSQTNHGNVRSHFITYITP